MSFVGHLVYLVYICKNYNKIDCMHACTCLPMGHSTYLCHLFVVCTLICCITLERFNMMCFTSLEGVSCENEAEFRSYEILLNLNQGDTLRLYINTLSKSLVEYNLKYMSIRHSNFPAIQTYAICMDVN